MVVKGYKEVIKVVVVVSVGKSVLFISLIT
jgi:hypothetical protein